MSAISESGSGERRTRPEQVNVSSPERFVSTALGGALALRGIKGISIGSTLLTAVGGYLIYRGLTGHCGFYETLGINTAVRGAVTIEGSILVDHSPEEVYDFWRDLENLPQFMTHLDSVKMIDGNRSHWVARTVEGIKVVWDSEIIEDRPGEMIRWRSLPDSDIDNEGAVYFKRGPGGRGADVRVSISYMPPAGLLGRDIAGLLRTITFRQLREELRRLKEIMEVPVEKRRAAGE